MKRSLSLLTVLLFATLCAVAQDAWVPDPAQGQELVADKDNDPTLVARLRDAKIQIGVGQQGGVFVLAIKLANTSNSAIVIPRSALILPPELQGYTLDELREMNKELLPLPYAEQPNVEVPPIITPTPSDTPAGQVINAYALGAQLRQLRSKEEVREYNIKVQQYNEWVAQENQRRNQFREWLESHKYWQTIALNPGEETEEYRYLLCKGDDFRSDVFLVKVKLESGLAAFKFKKP